MNTNYSLNIPQDRFIPSRKDELQKIAFTSAQRPDENTTQYVDSLCKEIFHCSLSDKKNIPVFTYSSNNRGAPELTALKNYRAAPSNTSIAHINTSYTKRLDAPHSQCSMQSKFMEHSKDNALAISLMNDAYVMSPQNHRIVATMNCPQVIRAVSWLDNQSLACGTTHGTITLFDVSTQNPHTNITFTPPAVITNISNSDPHTILATTDTNTLFQFDTRTNAIHFQTQTDSPVYSTKLCGSNPKLFACGTENGTIKLYDLRKSNAASALSSSTQVHQSAIKALSWLPGSTQEVLSGSLGSTSSISLTNTSTCKTKPITEVTGAISELYVFRNDPRFVLSAINGDHKKIQLWHYDKKDTILYKKAVYEGHQTDIVSLSVSDDEKSFATLSNDDLFMTWESPAHTVKNRNSAEQRKKQTISSLPQIR